MTHAHINGNTMEQLYCEVCDSATDYHHILRGDKTQLVCAYCYCAKEGHDYQWDGADYACAVCGEGPDTDTFLELERAAAEEAEAVRELNREYVRDCLRGIRR